METGTVRSWFDAKGFGFIIRPEAPGDIFVHYSQVKMEGRRCLFPGQQVSFRLERRERGLCAFNVEVLEDPGGVVRCHTCGQELQK